MKMRNKLISLALSGFIVLSLGCQRKEVRIPNGNDYQADRGCPDNCDGCDNCKRKKPIAEV